MRVGLQERQWLLMVDYRSGSSACMVNRAGYWSITRWNIRVSVSYFIIESNIICGAIC